MSAWCSRVQSYFCYNVCMMFARAKLLVTQDSSHIQCCIKKLWWILETMFQKCISLEFHWSLIFNTSSNEMSMTSVKYSLHAVGRTIDMTCVKYSLHAVGRTTDAKFVTCAFSNFPTDFTCMNNNNNNCQKSRVLMTSPFSSNTLLIRQTLI